MIITPAKYLPHAVFPKKDSEKPPCVVEETLG